MIDYISSLLYNYLNGEMMPKITAYKCRFTDELFDNRLEFIKHLTMVRIDLKAKRRKAKSNLKQTTMFNRMRDTCDTISDIEQFIRDNFNMFTSHTGKKPKLIDIHFTRMTYTPIHLTHAVPINYPKDWRHDKTGLVPVKGWTGHINMSIDMDIPHGISDLFKKTGIHTSSGSSYRDIKRGIAGSYGVYLFEDDWPAMMQNEIIKKLTKD